MKKKKFNYYNLFIYGAKFFLAMGLLFAVLFGLGSEEFVPFLKLYEAIFFVLLVTCTILMYIFLKLSAKYQKKITVSFEKPPKPFVYQMKNHNSFSQLFHRFIQTDVAIRTDVIGETSIYFYELHKWYYSKFQKYKMSLQKMLLKLLLEKEKLFMKNFFKRIVLFILLFL